MFESPWFDLSGKDLPLTVTALVFGAAWLVQMIWYWGIFSHLAFFRARPSGQGLQPVSIVISARNEYYNLMRNLRSVLEQDYPDFEVVLVDDASDDETEDFLKGLCMEFRHLNVVAIRSDLNRYRGKKFPLALGIKAAKHELILLTDADCKPASPHWLRNMQAQFTDKTSFVLGYGAYEPRKGLLNTLVRWETVHIAMQYLSHALAGQPYMGVGRNLAYRKSLFMSSGGFAAHYHLSGGDDDIFVNHNARGSTTRICIAPEARTLSTPPPAFSFWIRQKRRHLSTGSFYRPKHLFLLGLWTGSTVVFIALGIFLAATGFNLVPVGALLLLRLISQLLIFKKSMQQLSEKKLLLFSPVFEVFFILFNFTLALSNIIKRNHKWK